MLLRTKLLAFLIIAVLLTIGIAFVERTLSGQAADERFERAMLAGNNGVWSEILAQSFAKMGFATQDLTRNRNLVKALFKKDASKVSEAVETIYNRLSTSGLISDIRIAGGDGKVLYVANAEKVPADAATPVLEASLKTKEIRTGIWTTDAGSVSLRYGFPLYRRGKPVGAAVYILDVESSLAHFAKSLGANSFIVSATGNPLYKTAGALTWAELGNTGDSVSAGLEESKAGSLTYSVVTAPVSDFDGTVRTFVVSAIDVTESASQQARQTLIVVALAAVAVLVLVVAIWRFLVRAFRPLASAVALLEELRGGNTEIEVEFASNDEVGQIGSAISDFRERLIENQKLEQEARQRQLAESERTERLNASMESFDTQITEVMDTASRASQELQGLAGGLANTTEQSSQQAITAVAAFGETSASVGVVATSTNELSASFSEIADRVATSSVAVRETVLQAEQTSEIVAGLSDAANNIGDVVGMISEIAEQTNLLALNATIEAARAGDAGKGFAVVASEVKNLAGQTAKATEDITRQVSLIQSRTDGAVTSIREITERVVKIEGTTSAIAAAIAEQEATTQSIADNINDVAAAAERISETIREVGEMSERTHEASGRVADASSTMAEQSENMRACIGGFLDDVRLI